MFRNMSSPPPLPWKVRTAPERFILLFAFASALVGSLLLIARRMQLGFPVCTWKGLTGLPCVGCGGTRAVDLFLRGDFLGALAMNPVALGGVLFAAALTLYACGVLVLRLNPLRPAFVRGRAWRFVAVAALGANWVYLLLAGRV